MAKKKTKEEFIRDAKNAHGDKYDYSLVEYVNSYTKLKIICQKHGVFEQRPGSHIDGRGCNQCRCKTNDEFIFNCRETHGYKYDYSLVEYVNRHTKVKIICELHGTFEQTPKNHIKQNQGCPKCGGVRRLSTSEFITKSMRIHGDKYDYSLVEYVNNKKGVKIICKEHGVFIQKPNNHLNGQNCIICSNRQNGINSTLTTSEIIEKFKLTHGDKYGYSLVDYKGSRIKVKIICKKHGIFEQIPHNHINNQDCPKCLSSKGINIIYKILNENNLSYITEKTIAGCVSKKNRLLKFDIYIPKFDIYIEYDGEQHFKSIKNWGGEKSFIELKKRDNIKNKFCKKNNMILYRISYMDNIEEKTNNLLFGTFAT